MYDEGKRSTFLILFSYTSCLYLYLYLYLYRLVVRDCRVNFQVFTHLAKRRSLRLRPHSGSRGRKQDRMLCGIQPFTLLAKV